MNDNANELFCEYSKYFKISFVKYRERSACCSHRECNQNDGTIQNEGENTNMTKTLCQREVKSRIRHDQCDSGDLMDWS